LCNAPPCQRKLLIDEIVFINNFNQIIKGKNVLLNSQVMHADGLVAVEFVGGTEQSDAGAQTSIPSMPIGDHQPKVIFCRLDQWSKIYFLFNSNFNYKVQ